MASHLVLKWASIAPNNRGDGGKIWIIRVIRCYLLLIKVRLKYKHLFFGFIRQATYKENDKGSITFLLLAVHAANVQSSLGCMFIDVQQTASVSISDCVMWSDEFSLCLARLVVLWSHRLTKTPHRLTPCLKVLISKSSYPKSRIKTSWSSQAQRWALNVQLGLWAI